MSKISADNISNKDDTLEVPTETVIAGSAKAWVNFDSSAGVSINGSFNVSSITDVGTGVWDINYTDAMLDGNYAAVASGATASGSAINYATGATSTLVGSHTVTRESSGGVGNDGDDISSVVFAN